MGWNNFGFRNPGCPPDGVSCSCVSHEAGDTIWHGVSPSVTALLGRIHVFCCVLLSFCCVSSVAYSCVLLRMSRQQLSSVAFVEAGESFIFRQRNRTRRHSRAGLAQQVQRWGVTGQEHPSRRQQFPLASDPRTTCRHNVQQLNGCSSESESAAGTISLSFPAPGPPNTQVR